MGKVILCCGKKATIPYVIESTGTKLYTVEELCAYIGNNISTLCEEDLGIGLVSFFRTELDLKERADYLEHLFGVRATFKDVLVGVICSCDYYDEEEVCDILKEFDEFNSLPQSGKQRLRADRLMQEERYKEALHIYKSIITGSMSSELTEQEYGEILHNIAVIQIRQGIYLVAADSFEESYSRTGNKETLKQYLYALKLAKQDERFSRERARLVDDRNLYTEINRTLENVEYESTMTSDMDRLNAIKDLRSEGRYQDYEHEIERLIEELKRQYRGNR